jgi:hypothetical protein
VRVRRGYPFYNKWTGTARCIGELRVVRSTTALSGVTRPQLVPRAPPRTDRVNGCHRPVAGRPARPTLHGSR